ncbi:MAG: hypothetical protein HKO66_02540 [Saprospiraceae bacterium]|nr:cytochrome c [Bacteroidia bacterium]NNE14002.1 hypothetical protein [Saprospiraceae bacterium]NNL91091.1 hypothetical protein [Saprospiraceae bacterium]
MKKISKGAFFLCIILAFSCSRDATEPIDNSCGSTSSYNSNIKTIIDASCAYNGCHNGGGGAPGDFSTYDGLENVLTSGQFSVRVFNQKDDPNIGMPPDYATGGPINLTDEEILTLMDWVNSGFPEEENAIAATYDDAIKGIIDNSCAYSGCHDGQTGIGNYQNLEGLQGDIDDNDFFERVVEIREDPVKGMPPERAEELGGPAMLTDEEFQLILCWIENGYPQN